MGAFLGPLLAIFLLFSLKIELRSIFYLAIIPGLLAVLMMVWVKEKPLAEKVKSKVVITFHKFPAAYWRYLLVTAIFGIGNSSTAFLILQTKYIGVSLEGTIFIYAVFNLIAAAASYPSGFLSDKFGRKYLLFIAFMIFIFAYLGFAMTTSIFYIVMLFPVYGIFQGIFRAVGKALASDFVPAGMRASSIGWYSTTVGLSGLVASIIAGILWDKVGHTSVFVYGAVFAFFGSIALLVLIPKK